MSSVFSSFAQYLPAAALILLPNIGGSLSSLATRGESRWKWYNGLKKPSFNPPKWVFGPVWTGIYACMGVSSYLIYSQGGFAAQSLPLALYGVQLVLNWAWSPIFFYFHRIDLALIEMIALWGSIAATAYVFYPVNATAAYLLLPHLGWVSFATFLTYTYWKLNCRGIGDSKKNYSESH